MALRVALTGGIATGKSYVLARLAEGGAATIDADDIVHEALGANTSVAHAIATRLGTQFLDADGSVNRKRLGAHVFEDAAARRQLEAILHPLVYDSIREWFTSANTPIGVASIPLLYETRHERDFDIVVATHCDPATQLQRVIDRDGVSAEAAGQRIAAQLPSKEKARRADFVVTTDGTFAETDRQVGALMSALRNRASP